MPGGFTQSHMCIARSFLKTLTWSKNFATFPGPRIKKKAVLFLEKVRCSEK